MAPTAEVPETEIEVSVPEVPDIDPVTESEPEDVEAEVETEAEAEAPPEEAEPEKPPFVVRLDAEVDAKVLRAFLDPIRAVADEVAIHADRDGWTARVVDPAHIAMVDVRLPRELFDRYHIGGADGNRADYGVDLDRLLPIVKRAKGNVVLAMDTWTFKKPDGWMDVRIGRTTRGFAPVDTAGMSDPKVPDLTLPGRIAIAGTTLRAMVKEANEITDHLAITVAPDKVVFSAEGGTDRVATELDPGNGDVEYLVTVHETVRSLFPLDFLESFLKAVGKDARLELHVGQDYPLKVVWTSPLGGGTYLLAPRIESE